MVGPHLQRDLVGLGVNPASNNALDLFNEKLSLWKNCVLPILAVKIINCTLKFAIFS